MDRNFTDWSGTLIHEPPSPMKQSLPGPQIVFLQAEKAFSFLFVSEID